MENKSTLSWYKLYKHNIKEEKWFDKWGITRNEESPHIMLQRYSRNKFLREGEEKYQLSNWEMETLEHFLIYCEKNESIRNQHKLFDQWENINKEIQR